MGQAVVQNAPGPVTSEQIVRAFATLPSLGRANATTYAACPTGIFADGLPADAARRLADALAREGIAVSVVDDRLLPQLPERVIVQRIDCLPEKLVLYDALGRPRNLDWKTVAIVGSGEVAVVEFERREKTEWVAVGDTALPVSDIEHKEKAKRKGMLTMLLADRAQSFHAELDRLQYNYLGKRITQNRASNFLNLVRDLVGFASAAALNRGASIVRSGAPLPPYTSRQAFMRELRWLMWWSEDDSRRKTI